MKYTWITEGSGPRIYNTLDMLQRSPVLVLCEGELEALVVSRLCDVPAVGLPGSSTWRREYRGLFEDYDTVLVAGDGDQAGRDFTRKVCGDLKGKGKSVNLPDGMDLNEVFCEGGRDAVRQLLGLETA